MERYLEQLIEDMQEAAKRTPPPGELWDSVDMDDPGEIEDIAHVERYLYGTPQKLSEIVGIAKIQLPPAEKLTDNQTSNLLQEMIALLAAYHFVPEFPENLPCNIMYRILRENWDGEQVFVGAGETHIEFCDYDPDTCPYPCEFCDCRKFEEEEHNGTVMDEDDDWSWDEFWDDKNWPF